MRSPSGGEARHRGGTHIGKAPPSPEMTISGLTRGRLVGDDDVAKQIIFPGFAGRAARPSGGLFRFWAVILLNPNQRGIPHPLRREVKRLRLSLPSERPPATRSLDGSRCRRER